MNNTGLTVRAWNDAAIARRDEDGYANATAMCQANGREWKAYHRIDATKAYIEALAASLDLTPADLVITTTTGPNEFRGTWIHPRLAVDLARWISPDFAVWMDGWFLEQLEQQPQAPGLTAEDVARIAAETVRAIQLPQPRRRVCLAGIRHPESPAVNHLRLMAQIQRLSEHHGAIQWRDVRQQSSKAQRQWLTSDAWLMAIRDLEALDAGRIDLGVRGAHAYRATLSGFPASIY